MEGGEHAVPGKHAFSTPGAPLVPSSRMNEKEGRSVSSHQNATAHHAKEKGTGPDLHGDTGRRLLIAIAKELGEELEDMNRRRKSNV